MKEMDAENIYPDFFAKYYDYIYLQMRDSVDHKYFMDQMRKANGRVLEAGVGTGRFFTEAIAEGMDIYGIDVSPAMLDVLKTKVPAVHHHRISEQSIIDFKFDLKFSLITAPFRTFMHVTEDAEQMRALKNIHHHLERGGVFIFDAFIPNINILQNGIKDFTDFDYEIEPGLFLRRIVNAHSNIGKHKTFINYRFELEKDGVITSNEWNSCLRIFFRWEIETLMNASPFSNYKVYGDYKGNSIDKNSRDFVVVCQK